MEATRETNSHAIPDLIHDALFIAIIGGAVTALFFLVLDSFQGAPYHTAAVMGAALLEGTAIGEASLSLDVAALYSRFHIFAFALLGIVLSFAIHQVERRADHPGRAMAAMILVVVASIFALIASLMPGALSQVGILPVAMALALAALCVAAYLTHEHRPARWRSLKEAAHLA